MVSWHLKSIFSLQGRNLDEFLEIETEDENDNPDLDNNEADDERNSIDEEATTDDEVFDNDLNDFDVQVPEVDDDDDADQPRDDVGEHSQHRGGRDVLGRGDGPAGNTRSRACNCCCVEHCRLSIHTLGKDSEAYIMQVAHTLPCDLTAYIVETDIRVDNSEDVETCPSEELDECDTFTEVLLSLNLEM